MIINGAFIGIVIEHAADMFTIDQPILEGEFAIGRSHVSIRKDSQLHVLELGNVHHFLFRDPDIPTPSAASTAAGGAGGLVEGEGKSGGIDHCCNYTALIVIWISVIFQINPRLICISGIKGQSLSFLNPVLLSNPYLRDVV